MVTTLLIGGLTAHTAAAELQPQTAAAFARYVTETERQIRAAVEGSDSFLWVDRLPPEERSQVYARLRAGEIVVEPLETRVGEDEIPIPDGLVHHWIGTVLIPGVSLDDTLAVIRDYDRYADVYDPNVREARVLERIGHDRYRIYARLFMQKVVTVVLDTEYTVEFERVSARQVYVPSRTTRIVEVDEPGTSDEHAKSEGNDRGFMWGFNNYCSFEEQANGTFMQCESVSLSRGIPPFVGFIVRPFVNSVPRDSMTFTLDAARRRLTETR